MRVFERLVAAGAVLTFVGFAIAGCLSQGDKEKSDAVVTAQIGHTSQIRQLGDRPAQP